MWNLYLNSFASAFLAPDEVSTWNYCQIELTDMSSDWGSLFHILSDDTSESDVFNWTSKHKLRHKCFPPSHQSPATLFGWVTWERLDHFLYTMQFPSSTHACMHRGSKGKVYYALTNYKRLACCMQTLVHTNEQHHAQTHMLRQIWVHYTLMCSKQGGK